MLNTLIGKTLTLIRGISLKHWIDNNSITYRLRLLSTKYLSYPNGNSYLNIILANARIKFHNISHDQDLENILYVTTMQLSFHNAVKF